jgi:formate dehydrogenase major subunit/formate dehydrogenase alpha subunit
VKGRFAVPEVVGSAKRLLEPRELTPSGYEVVSWERALDVARDRLSDTPPGEFLMLLSPQLSNEDLFVAQQFARQVMGSEDMASLLPVESEDALSPFLDMACGSDTPDALDRADAICALGFDSRYGYSPIGVRVKRAAERGAALFTISDVETNLDLVADVSFKVESSQWAGFIRMLLAKGEKERETAMGADEGLAALGVRWDEEIGTAKAALARAAVRVFIAGPDVLAAPRSAEILRILQDIRHIHGWRAIMAHPATNLCGMVAMGALPGVKPGEALRRNDHDRREAGAPVRIAPVDLERRRRVVYVIGEACPGRLPPHDFLIYQNGLPAFSPLRPDLILPSALFTESAGTTITAQGRIAAYAQVVEPPGLARPDWWIMSRIAERMGRPKPAYGDVAAVQAEIRKHLKTFPETKRRITFLPSAAEADHGPAIAREKARPSVATGDYPFLLYRKSGFETYRGMPLAELVPGMRQIGDRGYLLVNSRDAAGLGVEEGGVVDVASDGFCIPLPVRTSAMVSEGVVHLVGAPEAPFAVNPCPVRLRRNNE